MIDTSNMRVLIFGNGAVGKRKSLYFQGKCAEISFSLKEDSTPIDVKIRGYDIIIAATNDVEFNRHVCAAAKGAGKWYNSSDEPGNFLIPATFTAGDAIVSVSTNGRAPAVSVYLRDYLSRQYPSLDKMIDLQEEYRNKLKNEISEQSERATILRLLLESSEIWYALDHNDLEKAHMIANKIIEER